MNGRSHRNAKTMPRRSLGPYHDITGSIERKCVPHSPLSLFTDTRLNFFWDLLFTSSFIYLFIQSVVASRNHYILLSYIFTYSRSPFPFQYHSFQFGNMRFSSILSVSCLTASAQAYWKGFNLPATLPSGACKSVNDWKKDFAVVKGLPGKFNAVRLYASSDCNTLANAVPAAKSSGMKVLVGVWSEVCAWSTVNVDTSLTRWNRTMHTSMPRSKPCWLL